jgi:hypothetical protein
MGSRRRLRRVLFHNYDNLFHDYNHNDLFHNVNPILHNHHPICADNDYSGDYNLFALRYHHQAFGNHDRPHVYVPADDINHDHILDSEGNDDPCNHYDYVVCRIDHHHNLRGNFFYDPPHTGLFPGTDRKLYAPGDFLRIDDDPGKNLLDRRGRRDDHDNPAAGKPAAGRKRQPSVDPPGFFRSGNPRQRLGK